MVLLHVCRVGYRRTVGSCVGCEAELLCCDHVSAVCPCGLVFNFELEGDDNLLVSRNVHVVRNLHHACLARLALQVFHCAVSQVALSLAASADAPRETVAAQVGEGELVLQCEFMVGERHEVDIAIHVPHLVELSRPLASRSDDAVAHEVALEAVVAAVHLSIIVA